MVCWRTGSLFQSAVRKFGRGWGAKVYHQVRRSPLTPPGIPQDEGLLVDDYSCSLLWRCLDQFQNGKQRNDSVRINPPSLKLLVRFWCWGLLWFPSLSVWEKLQYSVGPTSGKCDEPFPVVSKKTAAFFPVHEQDSRNIASLPRLCNRGMALIKDAYFEVTSEAACLLFVSVLCFPCWAPSSLRESTCKEYYPVLKHLSSQGVTLSLQFASGSFLYLPSTKCFSFWSLILLILPLIFLNHVYVIQILSPSVNTVLMMSSMGNHVYYRLTLILSLW